MPRIQNPWYNPFVRYSPPFFTVGEPDHEADGFCYYQLGDQSVLVATTAGKAVTQCVTIDGAKRELRRQGLLAEVAA